MTAGSQHGDDTVAGAGAGGTRRLEAMGWTMLRFWNDDVLTDIGGVCGHIVIAAGLAAADAARQAGSLSASSITEEARP